MSDAVTLRDVLTAAAKKVDARRLEQLGRILERAVGRSLSSQAIDDPIVIRRLLAETLREDGISVGVVQSFEQFYMGVIRRAAVDGLIPPPPEGPWTRDWQAVLDASADMKRVRAPLRSLAAWATTYHLRPEDVRTTHLHAWHDDLRISDVALTIVQDALHRSADIPIPTTLSSDPVLLDRLRRKALHGSVRVSAGSGGRDERGSGVGNAVE